MISHVPVHVEMMRFFQDMYSGDNRSDRRGGISTSLSERGSRAIEPSIEYGRSPVVRELFESRRPLLEWVASVGFAVLRWTFDLLQRLSGNRWYEVTRSNRRIGSAASHDHLEPVPSVPGVLDSLRGLQRPAHDAARVRKRGLRFLGFGICKKNTHPPR
jgi:hypothetical protein